MKKIILLVVFVFSFSAVHAQKYRTAFGVRVSKQQVGLTVQQLVLPKSTLELIASVGSDEYSGTALFEQHFPIISKGFNYYVGGGAHIGNLKDRGTFYGGDFILGTELKIPLLPFTISGDLKPAFHINHDDWFTMGGAFSIRMILLKEKKKKTFKLFGGDEEKDEKEGGIFSPKKETQKKKSLFDLFGEEEPEKKKGGLFGDKAE